MTIQKNTAATGLSPFRASRIYAEGWKAARQLSGPPENPYPGEPERSRWREGFAQAMT